MPPMKPFPHDAAGYVLFEARTGSNVGSAADTKELRLLLDEILEEAREEIPYVSVVALDDKGLRIGSWSAAAVLEDA